MGNTYQTKRTKIYHQFIQMAKERHFITKADCQKLIDFASLEHGTSSKVAQEVLDKMIRIKVFELKEAV